MSKQSSMMPDGGGTTHRPHRKRKGIYELWIMFLFLDEKWFRWRTYETLEMAEANKLKKEREGYANRVEIRVKE